MLRFILGRGGTGKTAYILRSIKELVESGEEQVLLLVPDQSSFETEKALLEMLGARLCRRVEVFGFEGMCRHVFAQTRSLPSNVIDNGTRAVLMSVALEQLGDKLTLLRLRRPRAVAEMLLGTLSECKTTDSAQQNGSYRQDNKGFPEPAGFKTQGRKKLQDLVHESTSEGESRNSRHFWRLLHLENSGDQIT